MYTFFHVTFNSLLKSTGPLVLLSLIQYKNKNIMGEIAFLGPL